MLVFVLTFFSACSLKKEYLKDISYSDLSKKIDNGETFFFTVVQDGCSHCASFTPKFEEILKEYNIIGYKLNYTNMTENELKSFEEKFGTNIGTPTTIFIVNGKEESYLTRLVGNQSKTKVIERLKTQGYISE